jgi:hypothetical protein
MQSRRAPPLGLAREGDGAPQKDCSSVRVSLDTELLIRLFLMLFIFVSKCGAFVEHIRKTGVNMLATLVYILAILLSTGEQSDDRVQGVPFQSSLMTEFIPIITHDRVSF